jgi:membrane protease YdiL (CAAX protease family)
MNLGNIRETLRDKRRFIIHELLIAAAILAAGFAGILPFTATPFLAVFGAIVLWLRGEGGRGVGLQRPSNWGRTLLFGLTAGVAYQFFSLYVLEPLIARFTGELPDVSLFRPLIGNWGFLLLSLVVAWTIAAFGEEFVYRGYFMNRIAEVAGGKAAAWLAALVVTSVIFGLGHLYQGTAGVITIGLNGLVFGVLYLVSRRNLWIPIVAHGVMDTVGFLLIFLGRYPGL